LWADRFDGVAVDQDIGVFQDMIGLTIKNAIRFNQHGSHTLFSFLAEVAIIWSIRRDRAPTAAQEANDLWGWAS
jgi:hypothetical protein